uniref:5'-(N(7)-methylguanosine 5'-triphospho)-[mRNA] hydrolase n=1 Tax=Periophthalmus magnuspinnatus TaxID=409849 RepID=A0A3B3Z9K3_9GOBI
MLKAVLTPPGPRPNNERHGVTSACAGGPWRGHLMSLAALQRQDPYINKLLDVTGQVALYNFNAKANEWEKTEIEGTLFVYSRSASPHHGFTIMNRLSTENLVEPINKDLEFQLQDPFLLYRNVNCEYPATDHRRGTVRFLSP